MCANLDLYADVEMTQAQFSEFVDSRKYLDYSIKVRMKRLYGKTQRRGHQYEMGYVPETKEG